MEKETELTVFQLQLKRLFTQNEREIIKDLIQLFLFKRAEKSQQNLLFVELYEFLGLEKFIEFLSLFEDKTLKVPSFDSFQEAVQTCICYYLKTYKNKSWDEIEKFMFMEETKPKKLGRKIVSFQNFLEFTHDKTVADIKQKIDSIKKQIEEAEKCMNSSEK